VSTSTLGASRKSKLVIPILVTATLAGGGGALIGHAHAQPIQARPPTTAPDVSALVTSVQPAVVNITVEQVSRRNNDDLDSFFPELRGRRPPAERKLVGAGSGFIIDDHGHVVTNAHVVDDADTVKVKLSDERELRAKVLGKDDRLDVAVLEIKDGKNLPHVSLGSSTSLKVGEPVVAIGNPFGLGGTVTSGIVSAKSRSIGAGPYDDFIQTDASINPGNSGGPLFDVRGQVVGMNTAISANGQGIGFAIPSDAIKNVLPQLIEKGHVRRGRLGASIQEVDEPLARALGLQGGTHGALIGELEHGGPAENAGIHAGDVIVSVDGTPVVHAHDLPRVVSAHAPGSRVSLEVKRGASTMTLPVTLAELEDESRAPEKHAARPASGDLGIDLSDARGGGAMVRRVAPSGPAAGELKPGDVIVEVDRQPVKSAADATDRLKRAATSKPILLRVQRDNATRWVAIDRSAPG
jgi:serine protease Do